jgi:DNA/RNA-binding domain of Phe-tRNA-synthetase-like protein
MRFIIDPSLSTISSSLSVAVIRIRLSQTARADTNALDVLKAESLEKLLERIPSGENADLVKISSISEWIQVYKTMGLKPKKVKPTHYAFSSRLLKDKAWPRSIGPLVDTYLANQM